MSLLVIGSVLVLLLTAVFMILHQHTPVKIPGLQKQQNRQPTVIITGPNNSGKTAFFNYLTQDGDIGTTLMSQEPNITHSFKLPIASDRKSNFKLIDFPGHIKLNHLVTEEIKSSTNIVGIVFMVDSSTDIKKYNEIAKQLFEILSVSEKRPGGIDILVACNKSDLFSARQASKIRDLLETEIDAIRKISLNNLSKINENGNDDADDDDNYSEMLAQSLDKKFQFDLLDGNFDVVAGSLLTKKVEKWENWIDERAVNC